VASPKEVETTEAVGSPGAGLVRGGVDKPIALVLRADGPRTPEEIAPDATVDELMGDFHARCRVEDTDRLPPEPPSYPLV
jgi:hypothetical protein